VSGPLKNKAYFRSELRGKAATMSSFSALVGKKGAYRRTRVREGGKGERGDTPYPKK